MSEQFEIPADGFVVDEKIAQEFNTCESNLEGYHKEAESLFAQRRFIDAQLDVIKAKNNAAGRALWAHIYETHPQFTTEGSYHITKREDGVVVVKEDSRPDDEEQGGPKVQVVEVGGEMPEGLKKALAAAFGLKTEN